MEAPRLLDYFAVYGLNEDFPVQPQGSESKSNPHSDFNVVSSVRLRVTNQGEALKPRKSKFLQLHELTVREGKRLWLEVVFGRLNGKVRPNWKGNAVSRISLFYVPCEGSYIMIPESQGYEPVPVFEYSQSIHQYSHTENHHHYYLGNYDIASLVRAKRIEGHKLVMACSYSDQEPPLNEITLIPAEEFFEESYKRINFLFGQNKDSYLCFNHIESSLETTFKAELIEKFPRKDHSDTPLSQAIHMFCFSEGIKLSSKQESCKCFSFILTTIEESSGKVPRIYVTCLIFYESLTEKVARQLNVPETGVFVPKAICLVSHWPFVENYKEILKEIYRLHLSNYEVPIERIICNLLEEVPLPSPGGPAVQFKIGMKSLRFFRHPEEWVPYVPSVCFEALFGCLEFQNVIAVWSCLMVEKKVLLVSAHRSLLTYAAMALVALLFPFKWEQVLIPVLPSKLKNYIEAIFPYIIGCSPEVLDDDIEVPQDTIRVYLDSNKLYTCEELPKLPEKLQRNLQGRLGEYTQFHTFTKRSDEAFDIVMPQETTKGLDCSKIRDAFLEFQTSLLKNYHKFFIHSEKTFRSLDARQCFNTSAFLSYHKANRSEHFLSQVSETIMFCSFVESAYSEQPSYFSKAMDFKRTKTDPSFIKEYLPQTTVPSLLANDIGIEPGMVFSYKNFPKLNDNLFCEPRLVKNLTKIHLPPHTLYLKDDRLIRMSQPEWAKFLLGTIYRLWFTTFTTCMPVYKDYGEELMDLAFQVVELMKTKANKPDEELFRRLIEACGHCSLKERVLFLFKFMKNEGIEPNACTHGVYVSAVAQPYEIPQLPQGLPSESLCFNLDLENCGFKAEDICPSCEHTLSHEEIMNGWERSYSNYTTKCPNAFCETKFFARFTVFYKVMNNPKAVQIEFLSPPLLKKELENLLFNQGKTVLLRKDFPDKQGIIFWNLAFYFNLIKLPNFFLSPLLDPRKIPTIVSSYLNRNSTGDQKTHSYNSIEELSETSSVASNETHSNNVDLKIQNFFKSRKKSSRSLAGRKSSRRKSSKNISLRNLFSPYINDFRNENKAKTVGQMT